MHPKGLETVRGMSPEKMRYDAATGMVVYRSNHSVIRHIASLAP